MSLELQAVTLQVLIVIQIGLFTLWIFNRSIPVVLCMIAALFWGLSCAWERLWEVYRDTLQRFISLRNSPVGSEVPDAPRPDIITDTL